MALALVLAVALAASSGPAEPPADVRDQVRALLGAIDRPVPPETFRALGPGAEDALAEFARSDVSPMRRVRALQALAGLGGARAEAVHREVAASSSAQGTVRRTAVRGLGRLTGPDRAVRELSPYLEKDRDPGVRAAAAEALATHAPADGCALVRARARAEPAPARFGRALSLCARAERAPASR